MVKDFVVAVAAGAGGCVSNIVLEAKGQLTSSDNRPGDVAGCVNGMQFAIDVRTFAIAISWPQYCKM